jgi:hypothetical protein
MTAAAVTGHGIAVQPPAGWDVRIYRRRAEPPETAHAVLHAATFPLPAARGDYGDGAVQLMGARDVFVALVEFHPSSTATALFADRGWPGALRPGDLSRSSLQVARFGQAGVQRWFTAADRAWCLYVVIGSWRDRVALVERANRAVASIEVR